MRSIIQPFSPIRQVFAPDGGTQTIPASSALVSPQTFPSPTPAGISDKTGAKVVVNCALGFVSAGVLGGCLEDLLKDAATSFGLKVFVKDPQTRSDLDLLTEPSFSILRRK